MGKPKNPKKPSRQSIRPSEEAYNVAMVAQIGRSGTLEAYDKVNHHQHHHHHHHHHHRKVINEGKAKWQPVRKTNAVLNDEPEREPESDSSSSSSSDEESIASGSALGRGKGSEHSRDSDGGARRDSIMLRKEDGSLDYKGTAKDVIKSAIKAIVPKRAKVRFQKVERDRLPWFVPPLYSFEEEESLFGDGGDIDKHYYSLNYIQRFFVMLEQPNSCKLSVAVNWLIMLVTLLSVGIYIISTIPEVRSTPDTCDSPACDDHDTLCPGEEVCAPEPPQDFDPIETFCLYVFVVDYFTRVLLCATVPPRLAGINPLSLPSASDKNCIESLQRCFGCNHLPDVNDEVLFNDRAAAEYDEDGESEESDNSTQMEPRGIQAFEQGGSLFDSLDTADRQSGSGVPPLALPDRAGRFGKGVVVVKGGVGDHGGRGTHSPGKSSAMSSPTHYDPNDFISTPGTMYSNNMRSPAGGPMSDVEGGAGLDSRDSNAGHRSSEMGMSASEQDSFLDHGSTVSGKHHGHPTRHQHHRHPRRTHKGASPTLTTRSGSIKGSHIMTLKSQVSLEHEAEEVIVMDKALASKMMTISGSALGGFKIPKLSQIHIIIAQVGHYVLQWMNMVDFIAIIPFFLQVSGGSASGSTLSIVRVLRLARILRVLKLGKGSKGLQVLLATMVSSLPALVILGFFSMIGFILLGSLEYFFEGGNFKVTADFPSGAYMISDVTGTTEVPSKYDSIPISMYWSIITSTGVGFGDIYPVTYYGRGIAVLAMYGGILVLALPISVIGNNFERLYDQSLGHLSYGVVNAILELMEDEDHDEDVASNREAYYDMAFQNHALMGDAGVSDEGVFKSRRELLEKRASKLASVFVIAQVCLKEGESDDINRLLVKVGLRDMIAALEYVYDLDFRHQQLEDFVLHAVATKKHEEDLAGDTEKPSLRDVHDGLGAGMDEGDTGYFYNPDYDSNDGEDKDHDADYGRAVADREAARVMPGMSVKSSSVVHGSIKAGSPRPDSDSDKDEDDDEYGGGDGSEAAYKRSDIAAYDGNGGSESDSPDEDEELDEELGQSGDGGGEESLSYAFGENVVVTDEVISGEAYKEKEAELERRRQHRIEAEKQYGKSSGHHFEASADLDRGTFHFSSESRKGGSARRSRPKSRRRTSIKDVFVPGGRGKSVAYIKRLSIGEYTFAVGQTEIDFEQIEYDETAFYQSEFKRLNARTRELLRYLRKSPEYMARGYLRKMYEAALKGHTVEEEENEKRKKDEEAALAADLTKTPEERRMNAAARAEKAIGSVQRFNNDISDPKHLLAMAKRRVTLAYRRVQMAMHELESEERVPPRSPTRDGVTKTTTSTHLPFSKSDTALQEQHKEGDAAGGGANATPPISRIPSDADVMGVSPLTVVTEDSELRGLASDATTKPQMAGGSPKMNESDIEAAAGAGTYLTPDTVRTHLPSGNTPLPNDSGSPDTRVTPPRPPAEE